MNPKPDDRLILAALRDIDGQKHDTSAWSPSEFEEGRAYCVEMGLANGQRVLSPEFGRMVVHRVTTSGLTSFGRTEMQQLIHDLE